MDITEIRRVNIRTLVEKRGMLSKLSKALGYKNPSFLSQMVGPNPTREVTEKFARRVEEAAGLEPGVLDRPRDGVPTHTQAPAAQTPATAPRTDTLVAKREAEEPEEKKARRFHAQRLTEGRPAANRELGRRAPAFQSAFLCN